MNSQTRQVNALPAKLRALELRLEGKTYDAIAAEIGKSRSMAHKYVKRALVETLQEPADELRTLQAERIRAVIEVLWPKVLDGDFRAMDRLMRAMDQLTALYGLNAPTRTEHSGEIDVRSLTDAEIEAILKAGA